MLPRNPRRADLRRAVACLRRGEVLAYPTEGVWGLGCDPKQLPAFRKILRLKGRAQKKGVLLITGQDQHTHRYCERDAPLALNPADYWPGTTLVLPACAQCPRWIRGRHSGIALRVSAHPAVQQLSAAFGGAIVSTSANPAGKRPARSLREVYRYFGRRVTVLSARLGGARRPSTIIDARSGKVLRSG
ncbi:L-threonylcarbamoyladenylate synthase [Acidithiobacillus sp. IBUN Pt1247-S3]|uniref:L-threonylcarbamoyladenylate synthase n=1 Tax=Acidithiobacillus sp. IBUN Pt1247-S3 TaxID=3166642 RepID=UPI0034E47839